MHAFKDHFSTLAEAYSRYRPTYPEDLYAWLAEISPNRSRVWDCATGGGQAARVLADHFDLVTASDASSDQIANCTPHPKVAFRVAPAENSGLPDSSVDLITVAQAVHWFDFNRFYAEARRVARPGAPIVVWSYAFFSVNEAIDAVIDRYANGILGSYWPPERAFVDNRYRDLPFPFIRIEGPSFQMTRTWKLDHVLGYLTTWSSRKNYMAEKAEDPLVLVQDALAEAWGPKDQERLVRWPMFYLAGTVQKP